MCDLASRFTHAFRRAEPRRQGAFGCPPACAGGIQLKMRLDPGFVLSATEATPVDGSDDFCDFYNKKRRKNLCAYSWESP